MTDSTSSSSNDGLSRPKQEVTYHPNGAMKEQLHLNAEQVLHGPYLEYNEEGQVITKAFFENGELDGSYAKYEDDGRVNVIFHYKKGKLDGESKIYTEGRLALVGEYVDGKKHGKEKFYSPTGRVTGEREYQAGKKHGVSIFYNDLGQVVKTETHRNDQLEGPTVIYAFPPLPMERTYYKNNQPVEKITYSLEEKTRGKYQHKIIYKAGQPGAPIPLDPDTGAELAKSNADKKTAPKDEPKPSQAV